MVRDWPQCGYVRFGWHPETFRWSQVARREAQHVAADPDMIARWLQCESTWFVGVDALPTDTSGAIAGTPLAGPAKDRIGSRTDLHPAQLSIMYPGYPKPRTGESETAFRYRLRRDAAHMDGVIADGMPKRRYLRERHDWILGLPLTETSPGASTLVVWAGSHLVLQQSMIEALGHLPEARWPDVDITDVYVAARKRVFETCPRIPLFTRPGEAVLLNPFLLHGVAPWQPGSVASEEGRMIAYLRPESRESAASWIRQK